MTSSKWTMEVPAGKDGRPVRVGDLVREDGHDLIWHVRGIGDGRLSVFAECNSTWVSKWLRAEDLVHVEPEPDTDEDVEVAEDEDEPRTHDADKLASVVAECTSEKALSDAGLMRLPVDADGEPWHVGDVADCDGKPCTISCIRLKGEGWSMVGNSSDGHTWKCNRPSEARHHTSTPAERIRVAVRLLTDEDEPQDARALKDLLAVADELEGGAE